MNSSVGNFTDSGTPAGCDVIKKNRVIFVNRFFHPDTSATSQMLYDLTRRLSRRGYDVHVVCSRQLYCDAKARLPGDEYVEGIHVHRVAGTHFGRDRLTGRAIDYGFFYIRAFNTLRLLARAGDILVAKTDPPLISVPVSLVARWRRAHLVNWLQDVFPEIMYRLNDYKLPWFFSKFAIVLRNQSLRSAAANVVIGERMKEHIIGCGVDETTVCVIENWSDGNFISPMPVASSKLRAQLGLQGKFVVGYSGNMGRAHEYDTILNAAIALRENVDVAFLMIGGGIKFQQLKTATEKAALGNFIFMPYQPRESLSASMAAADVHLTVLLPTLEGLIVPSKFYGILAAGRPTIAIGDVDGEVARVLRREQCGCVVTIKDHITLKNELLRLKENTELVIEMGKKAYELFASRHTADHAATKWFGLLDEMQAVERRLAVMA